MNVTFHFQFAIEDWDLSSCPNTINQAHPKKEITVRLEINNTFSLLYLPESRSHVVISIYRIGLFNATLTPPSTTPPPASRITSKWPGVGSYFEKTPEYSSKTFHASSNRSRQLAQKSKVARINHPNLPKMELARMLESDRMDDRQQLSARRKYNRKLKRDHLQVQHHWHPF